MIQKIFLVQIVILLTLTSCSETSKRIINLNDFLSPTSKQIFKYKMSMQNSNQFSGTTNMDNKYIEKSGNKIANHCVNIKSYLLFNSNDLKQMPQSMQEIVKKQHFRVENTSEQLCSKNGILTLNEMVIYKNSNNWENKLQAKEFNTKNNIQKTRTVVSSCTLVDISEKLLFDKKRKVIHSQCSWNYNGSRNKIEYFIAEGLGLYKLIHSSSYREPESKSIMTVTLDEIINL